MRCLHKPRRRSEQRRRRRSERRSLIVSATWTLKSALSAQRSVVGATQTRLGGELQRKDHKEET